MLGFLPGPVLGVLGLTLISLNTILWALPLYPVILVKLITPGEASHRLFTSWTVGLAEAWIHCNNAIENLTQQTKWDVRGVEGLDRRKSYLISSNHQSWADVLVLQRALIGHAPFLRFFIKRQLIWVPVLGLAWWGMDFPFMRRFSREFLEKHPEMRGKDLEETRKFCEAMRGAPVSILSFLEGTRLTEAKRVKQGARYENLLKPKVGALAFVLGAMGDVFDSMLDVSVVYPEREMKLWDFVCNRAPRIVVDVRTVEIPASLLEGDYHNDPEYRARLNAWVDEVWRKKDERLSALIDEADRSSLDG